MLQDNSTVMLKEQKKCYKTIYQQNIKRLEEILQNNLSANTERSEEIPQNNLLAKY